MTSTNIMPSRDTLINHIIRTLEPYGFVRTADAFEAVKYVVQPGSRMIINGVVYEQPPTKIPFTLHIELHGPGSVSSPDGRTEHFELIGFGVKVGDEYRGESANVYYDEVERFNEHLKIYFNL